jgi:hypothetical protein
LNNDRNRLTNIRLGMTNERPDERHENMTTAAQPFGNLGQTKGLQKKSMFRRVDRSSFSRSFALFRYLDGAGYLLSMIIVLWIYSVHVRSIVQYPYFAPSANVEELAYTHISSSNFNKFGFLASGFLQDFAASPNRSDHPYVYDHMPPGPDVARALVMRVTGGSFVWTAIVFASLVPIGFVFYFLFLNNVFQNRFVLSGIFLLLLTPWEQYVAHFSNPIWNAFLLLAFAPLVALHWSYQYKAPWLFFVIGLPLILISSVYLDYVVSSSILACWLGLYFSQIVRLDRREIVLAIGAIAFGIFLNLLKNFIYFGPSLFAQELFYVLSNRISGWPSQQELASFYTTHGILHHGARPPKISVLWEVIRSNLYFDGLKYFLLAAATSLLLTIRGRIQTQKKVVRFVPTAETIRDFKFILKMLFFIVALIITPIVIFPAFAQEVNLNGGTNFIWLGFLCIALASLAATRLIVTALPAMPAIPTILIWWRTRSVFFKIPSILQVAAIGVFVCASVLLVAKIPHAIGRTAGLFASIHSRYKQNPNVELEQLRKFASAPFMTNINVPTVYFFTGSAGFGVCGLDSIADKGNLNLDGCKIALVRDRSLYAHTRPSYFFFFKVPPYFPGFADCGPPAFILPAEQQLRAPAGCFEIQRSRLDKNFLKVLDTNLYSVYDLNQNPS